MNSKQRTIATVTRLKGIGLHTGKETIMTFKPAPPDSGVVFVRSDLSPPVRIPATLESVIGVVRGTTLGKGNVRIHTVEHSLSALYGLGIDNLEIELDADETPVGDGSALPIFETIQKVGIREQEAERRPIRLTSTVTFSRNGVQFVALPGAGLRISCTIDYNHPVLKSQYKSLVITPESYGSEVAGARTFCFDYEVESLRRQGLARGGSLENAIVVGENKIHNPASMRFPDGFVRHKILDFLGDLFLLGRPLEGHMILLRPGHASNILFARKIYETQNQSGGK